MSRAVANKLYRTFVKGLITEASPLTFPENSSIDEDNCVIYLKGNRSRRLGIDLEPDYLLSNYYLSPDDTDLGVHRQPMGVPIKEYQWTNVGTSTAKNFLVYQQGRYLSFFDLNMTPLETKPFFVDLNDFIQPFVTDVTYGEVVFTSGNGYLFVAGDNIDPFYVAYDDIGNSISTHVIDIQIRDFVGVQDGYTNEEERGTLDDLHNYNLLNQGWSDPSDPIDTYFSAIGTYPSNSKQWWNGRDGTTLDFDPTLLNKQYVGSSHAPRGHFILDPFYKDRAGESGIGSIPIEQTEVRSNCVTFFSGRVWYACNSTVYFSQIIDDISKVGRCYQEADPTSEFISELIQSDGGVVPIPDMGKCVRLVAYVGGVLCFATNGIWYISGSTAAFTASDISVIKISSIGTQSASTIVEVGQEIYWWSNTGIQKIVQAAGALGAISGQFTITNVSLQTIQGFYLDTVTPTARQYAKGMYNPANNTIQWLFKSDSIGSQYFYNRVLVLDLTLGCFYPWTISSNFNSPYVVGMFLTPSIVYDAAADNGVIVQQSNIKYICVTRVVNNYYFTAGLFGDPLFRDWFSFDNIGRSYESYVETGYELLEDAMRKKQTTYVFTYFRQTETAYVLNEEGSYEFDYPSSCTLVTKWDWANSTNSNKWSPPIEVYRFRRLPAFSETDLDLDTGFAIVTTKNKVRGSGKSIQFRFSNNQIGKDFDLLGWSVEYSGNSSP